MKKFVLICLCLTLTVAALIPAVAFAQTPTDGAAEDIIYFLNPTAITAVGDYLFVADKIEDNTSAILCFDIASDTPVYKYTYEVTGNVSNLSAKDNSGLYVVLSDKIVELTISDRLTEANSWVLTNAVDVAYGVDGSINTEYILKTNELVRNNVSGNIVTFTNGIACVAIENNVYYLYEDNNNIYCKDYDGNQHTHPSNGLNNANPTDPSYYLTSFSPKGMFVWQNDKVTLFDSSLIRYISFNESSCFLNTLLNYANTDKVNPEKAAIVDVASQNDKLYILNDKNKIEVYKNTEVIGFELIATIGSDEVQQDVPTVSDYTSFTLVHAKGYPANIVFKTTGENSLSDIETEAHEYIIIGYNSDETSRFYYVFVRDTNGAYKFGWVKKSDNAAGVADDSKLEIVNTEVVPDDTFSQYYKTKFNSLNAVWLYDLPCSNFKRAEAFTQSATSMTEVTVLQKFEEIKGNEKIIWLYVSYQDGDELKTGFVHDEDVGRFYDQVDVNSAGVCVRKINATLFDAVTVYKTEDMQETATKLYSGDVVFVIAEHDGIALIQKAYSDGTVVFGFVYSDRLIGENAITTNAIVGLTLLAIAIALVVVLVVVYFQRKKRKTTKVNTSKDNG